MAINQRKMGTILTYVQMLLTTIIGLIYTPFMLDLLGQSEYGLFGTASSLTSYLGLLSFGVAGAYLKHIMECRVNNDKDGEAKLNGMFITIFAFFSFLVIIVGTVLIFISDDVFKKGLNSGELNSIKWIILFAIINYVVTFFTTPVTLNILSHERYVFNKVLYLILNIINPVINIIVLLFFPYAVAVSFVTLIVAMLFSVIQYIYAYNKLKMRFIFKCFDLNKVKSVFAFSSFLLLNDITNTITNSTDRLVLGALSGTVVVAIYTVGTNFTNYFATFSTSVSSVFAPQINKIVAESKLNNRNADNDLNKIFLKVGRIQFIILTLVVIGFSSIGKQFIILWAGEEYVYSFWVALFLILGPYIPFIQNTGLEIQKAKNMHKARSLAYFLVAVANVILTIPASLYFSRDEFPVGTAAVAAVVVTFLCIIFGQVIFMNVYYQRKVGVDVISFWKSILKMIPGMLIPLAFGFILPAVIPISNFLMLFTEAFMISVVYAVSVYFLSMNDYERQLFISPIKKVFSKIKNIKK